MTDYVDRTFVDEDITLDGNRYTRCTFDGCVLRYNGGPLAIEGGFAFKNGGNITFGEGVDPVNNPLSQFLVQGSLAQGFRQLSDQEIASQAPITPKKDLG